MNGYFDSSALAKVALGEKGDEDVRRLIASVEIAASSRIGVVECHSAVRRSAHEGVLRDADLGSALRNLSKLWNGVLVVEADRTVCNRAIEILATMRLRGSDAIHLASALQFAGKDLETTTFAAWDERLRRAADSVGFTLFPA